MSSSAWSALLASLCAIELPLRRTCCIRQMVKEASKCLQSRRILPKLARIQGLSVTVNCRDYACTVYFNDDPVKHKVLSSF
ncbi:hypothetical protein SLA2020_341010 [Shorea laevis]